MASWPSTLPAPLKPGYGLDPEDQTLRTDMEVGAARARRRTRARKDMLDVVWKFTDAQMAVFRAWFEDETLGVSGGAAWFTVPLPLGDGGLSSREARFKGPWKSKLGPGMCWQVMATLELRGGDMTADQRLAAILGLVVDGIYPSLVLPFSDTKALDSRITFARASTATYFDANGVMQTAASGAARFDHDPVTGESLGLLIEEASTNLLTYSEQFDNAAWAGYEVTVVPNAATAPDGTLTADKIVANTGTTQADVRYTPTLTVGVSYVLSLYAKAGEYNLLRIGGFPFGGGGAPGAKFNLSTGAVVDAEGLVTTSEYVGDGWWRISVAGVPYVAGPGFLYAGFSGDYTGDGSSGCYVWGAQLEAVGDATSYIPTTSAAVTRAADVASMTGTNFSSWFNPVEGTFVTVAHGARSSGVVLTAFKVSPLGVFELYLSGGIVKAFAYASATIQADMALGTPAINTEYSCAFAYRANDFAGVKDGGTVITDTSVALPTVDTMTIGEYLEPTAGTPLNGHIKRLAYYPSRLTNAQLQALTA